MKINNVKTKLEPIHKPSSILNTAHLIQLSMPNTNAIKTCVPLYHPSHCLTITQWGKLANYWSLENIHFDRNAVFQYHVLCLVTLLMSVSELQKFKTRWRGLSCNIIDLEHTSDVHVSNNMSQGKRLPLLAREVPCSISGWWTDHSTIFMVFSVHMAECPKYLQTDRNSDSSHDGQCYVMVATDFWVRTK